MFSSDPPRSLFYWPGVLLTTVLLFLTLPAPVEASTMTIAPIPHVEGACSFVGWKYFEAVGTITCGYEVTGSGFQHRTVGAAEWTTVPVKAMDTSYSAWIPAPAGEDVELRAFLSYRKPAEKPKTVYSAVTGFAMREAPSFTVSYRNLTQESATVEISVQPNGNPIKYLWIYRERVGHGVDMTSMLASDVLTAATFSFDFTGWSSLTPGTAYLAYPAFLTPDQLQVDGDVPALASGVSFTTPSDPAATTAAPTPAPSTDPASTTATLTPMPPSPSPVPTTVLTPTTVGGTSPVITTATGGQASSETSEPSGTTMRLTSRATTAATATTAEATTVTGLTPQAPGSPGTAESTGGSGNRWIGVLAGTLGAAAVGTAVYAGWMHKRKKGSPPPEPPSGE